MLAKSALSLFLPVWQEIKAPICTILKLTAVIKYSQAHLRQRESHCFTAGTPEIHFYHSIAFGKTSLGTIVTSSLLKCENETNEFYKFIPICGPWPLWEVWDACVDMRGQQTHRVPSAFQLTLYGLCSRKVIFCRSMDTGWAPGNPDLQQQRRHE